jgi:hypothetical protein
MFRDAETSGTVVLFIKGKVLPRILFAGGRQYIGSYEKAESIVKCLKCLYPSKLIIPFGLGFWSQVTSPSFLESDKHLSGYGMDRNKLDVVGS